MKRFAEILVCMNGNDKNLQTMNNKDINFIYHAFYIFNNIFN